MGRKNRQKEDEQRQRVENAEYALRNGHRQRALLQKPEFVTEFAHFPKDMRERVTELHAHYVHEPHTWVPRIKSKAEPRRFLDAVEYIFFERYVVPSHLKNNWLATGAYDRVLNNIDALRGRQPNFHLWYVIAARGGSLYKEVARPYLSKQELHYFLNAPEYVSSSRAAYWYAVARPHCEDSRHAMWVSMSRISAKPIWPIGESPWQEVARYFARNPTNFHQISDLSDYIEHEITEANARPLEHPLERRTYSLKGRSLSALRRRQEEWHRALRKQRSIGGGQWNGMDIPDVDYEAGKKDKRTIWKFRQIKTGDALFKEGQRMHHCVAGYKSRCMSGQTNIWSLTYEFPPGIPHRGLTIQVDGTTIVQVRGYANRQPLPNERVMVRTWANEHRLSWSGRG